MNVYKCICMYEYIYVGYVCMYAYIRTCVQLCMHLCVYACMYICMHVCIHVCMYAIFKLGFERYTRGNCYGWEGELSRVNCPGGIMSKGIVRGKCGRGSCGVGGVRGSWLSDGEDSWLSVGEDSTVG